MNIYLQQDSRSMKTNYVILLFLDFILFIKIKLHMMMGEVGWVGCMIGKPDQETQNGRLKERPI